MSGTPWDRLGGVPGCNMLARTCYRCGMATLHVRNVPDDTYEALRRRAVERRSSIGAEAIRLLRRGLMTDTVGLAALVDDIEARRPVPSRRVPSVAALIRRDRNAR